MESTDDKPRAVWKLRRGAGRKFLQGHPWVFANELRHRSLSIEAGAVVELRDQRGLFLAWGFGHPQNRIAFRAVSRQAGEEDAVSISGLARRLRAAWQKRARLGLSGTSFRLCFGEADALPGLVIDRYLLAEGQGQVLVLQPQSAGAERCLPRLPQALAEIFTGSEGVAWPDTAVVVRRDAGARRAEGLPLQETEITRSPQGLDLAAAPAVVRGVVLTADLIGGQKTGLFLDQADNQSLVLDHLARRWAAPGAAKIVSVADLFCYVGQWGSRVAAAARAAGRDCEILAGDASASALALAEINISRAGGNCRVQKLDLLQDIGKLPPAAFELVVLDPPALIKERRHLPSGRQGYLKLNLAALRLLRPGGWLASASCSGGLAEPAFQAILEEAARRCGRRVSWIGSGGQAADHPLLPVFPEGNYLKFRLGLVE